MSLAALPREVLLEILFHASNPTDLLSLARTNRMLYSLYESNEASILPAVLSRSVERTKNYYIYVAILNVLVSFCKKPDGESGEGVLSSRNRDFVHQHPTIASLFPLFPFYEDNLPPSSFQVPTVLTSSGQLAVPLSTPPDLLPLPVRKKVCGLYFSSRAEIEQTLEDDSIFTPRFGSGLWGPQAIWNS